MRLIDADVNNLIDDAPTVCCEECKWSEDGRLGPLDELCGVPGCEDFGCAYFERRTT